MDRKCDTIGCKNRAEGDLAWIDRDTDESYLDRVCVECGESYAHRPALRATFYPYGMDVTS